MIKKWYSNNMQGFSLLEIGVVLAVLGLIVSGVLVGKDLIEGAKVRAVISDIGLYNSATVTFKETYGKFPGDYDNARANLGNTAYDGDGNGYVFGGDGLPHWSDALSINRAGFGVVGNEFVQFFHQLYLAKLIDTPLDGSFAQVTVGVNFPALKTGIGAMMFLHDSNLKPYWYLGIDNNNTSVIPNSAAILAPFQAYRIDYKLDDGDPTQGNIVVASSFASAYKIYPDGTDDLSSYGGICITGAGDPATSSTAYRMYNLNYFDQACKLRIGLN